jgi:hypothetical protein
LYFLITVHSDVVTETRCRLSTNKSTWDNTSIDKKYALKIQKKNVKKNFLKSLKCVGIFFHLHWLQSLVLQYYFPNGQLWFSSTLFHVILCNYHDIWHSCRHTTVTQFIHICTVHVKLSGFVQLNIKLQNTLCRKSYTHSYLECTFWQHQH